LFVFVEHREGSQKNDAMLWLVFGCKYLHKVMSVAEKVVSQDERLVVSEEKKKKKKKKKKKIKRKREEKEKKKRRKRETKSKKS